MKQKMDSDIKEQNWDGSEYDSLALLPGRVLPSPRCGNCQCSLQALLQPWHSAGPCPSCSSPASFHYVFISFRTKVQAQLELPSESVSGHRGGGRQKKGRVTFSIVVCVLDFLKWLQFWGLRGSSHFQVWVLTHVLPSRATERKGGAGGAGVEKSGGARTAIRHPPTLLFLRPKKLMVKSSKVA